MKDMNPPPRRRPGDSWRRLLSLVIFAAFAYAAWYWVHRLFGPELAGAARWLHRVFS